MTNPTKPAGLIVAFLSIALLGGCAIGPNYRRPVVETPPAYRGEDIQGAPTGTLRSTVPWRFSFLIQRAITAKPPGST